MQKKKKININKKGFETDDFYVLYTDMWNFFIFILNDENCC